MEEGLPPAQEGEVLLQARLTAALAAGAESAASVAAVRRQLDEAQASERSLQAKHEEMRTHASAEREAHSVSAAALQETVAKLSAQAAEYEVALQNAAAAQIAQVTPLQNWLFTPELQRQSRGKRRILQGRTLERRRRSRRRQKRRRAAKENRRNRRRRTS